MALSLNCISCGSGWRLQRLTVITVASPGDGELTQVLVIPSERAVRWHGALHLNRGLFPRISVPLRDIDACRNPWMRNTSKRSALGFVLPPVQKGEERR